MTVEKLSKIKSKLTEFGLMEEAKKYFYLHNYVAIETFSQYPELIEDPDETVKECYKLVDEIFPNDELPCDDAFRNLVLLKEILDSKGTNRRSGCGYMPDLIREILEYPHSQIIDAMKVIREYTDCSKDELLRQFEKHIGMFFRSNNEIEQIISCVTDQFGEDVSKAVFWDVLSLGIEKTEEIISYFKKCTGIYANETMRKMYVPHRCEELHNSSARLFSCGPVMEAMKFLFDALPSDKNIPRNVYVNANSGEDRWRPLPEHEFLRTKDFDHETIAHILVALPCYLKYYMPMSEWDVPCGDNIHGTPNACYEICDLVRAYEIQLDTADSLNGLRGNITTENANKLWEDEFVPLYNAVRDMFFDYPYCPKLVRELTCTVTAFSSCDFTIPQELERYNAGKSSMIIREKAETGVESSAGKDELEVIANSRIEVERIWTLMREELIAATTPTTYDVFFGKLVPVGLSDKKIILKSNSKFLMDLIELKYMDLIKKLLGKVTGCEMDVQFVYENES